MNELLKAKAELEAELTETKNIDISVKVAEKIAAKKAELDAQLEAFKTEAAQSETDIHNNAVAELVIGLKYIDRAIARAEAVQTEPSLPEQTVPEQPITAEV